MTRRICVAILLCAGAFPAHAATDVTQECAGIEQSLGEVATVRDAQRSSEAFADASRVHDELRTLVDAACGGSGSVDCVAAQGARDRADAIAGDVTLRAQQTRLTYLEDLGIAASHVHIGLVGLAGRVCRARAPVRIGSVGGLRAAASAVSQGGARRTLAPGGPVYLSDRILTDGTGRVQVLLLDETVFTLGPNADMVLDEFVYDPATSVGKVGAALTKGVFRFVTGRIGKRDPASMKVTTSVGVIGIRGTDFIVSTDEAEVAIHVNEGAVVFDVGSTGQGVPIAAGSSGTFGQRDATVSPMSRATWDGLVASISPPGATRTGRRRAAWDQPVVIGLVWLVLVLLTMPIGMRMRARRLARQRARDAAVGAVARYCSACGAPALSGASYCTMCGAALSGPSRADRG